jgi:UDP-N-acetylglucosamine/UDP-N-acetylgalactosamine diphosphorylase
MTEGEIIRRWTGEGQAQLFEHWRERPEPLRRRLLEDLAALKPALVRSLAAELRGGPEAGPIEAEPLDPVPLAGWRGRGEARAVGEELFRHAAAAFLTVAGGQGTRLGWEGPKGCFPISPIRGASLFQILAEKLLAARRRYEAPTLWYIMTSPLNHGQISAFFGEHDFFGLPPEEVVFFVQAMLPTLSPTGKLLLAEDGGLAMHPGGHGGALDALRARGLLGEMSQRGIEELFYFQVDNPLVRVPDPEFAGFHRLVGSELSSKVVPKAYPEEKLGVPGRIVGRPRIIEYSELGRSARHERRSDGRLRFAYGSIAVHMLNVRFLASASLRLPLHQARKKVQVMVPGPGGGVQEEREAIKLEKFIFDAIPLAANAQFLETEREEEFAPLKNASGQDSIETCREGLTRQQARWLERCGVQVPKREGRPSVRIEISPLYADSPEELKNRLGGTVNKIDEDTLLA